VREFSDHIQDLVQRNVDEMLKRRKHIFWGRVLGRAAPVYEAPTVRIWRAGGDAQ
jgi:hypothetical protein